PHHDASKEGQPAAVAAKKEPPIPQTGTSPAAPPRTAGPPTFDDWLQDLDAAQRQAARAKKDLLIVLDGSDWCGWAKRLARQVLLRPGFRRQASERVVPVVVGFPRGKAARARVQDAARNARLQNEFQVESLPTVVLADDQGRPYAVTGYEEGGAAR